MKATFFDGKKPNPFFPKIQESRIWTSSPIIEFLIITLDEIIQFLPITTLLSIITLFPITEFLPIETFLPINTFFHK